MPDATPIIVLPCIDNVPGLEALRYLLGREKVRVPAVIVHPAHNVVCGEEIAALCGEHGVEMIDIQTARAEFDARIRPLAPDFVVSIYFDYILDARFLQVARRDSINLHPGYLPYNKGFYYYAWAELDGTPAGVSIHRMVSEVDAGPIISQSRVRVDKADTGVVIYDKHLQESIRLFQATWPSLEDQSYHVFPQRHKGTFKKIAQANAIRELDPEQRYTAREFVDLLRVFTFGERGGCTIELDGKRYSVAVSLNEVGEQTVVIPGTREPLRTKTSR
ncbi:formyltransferase family protein [Nannocystis sp. ILAH1]|uniref:formyltransferase family protein n=1 Tax=unclassified Nannocystis TaxID=2627009 RepID=UPI00227063A6|nr:MULTISPECIES: formyltransferase family protein [unclassified Nannocystis]MCY0990742.1 formyltransferase family protein [Nannocystis sp. ILAH1]MCY1072274.1 formyltransferase family protein [Nannocystis sp. RBIL2]